MIFLLKLIIVMPFIVYFPAFLLIKNTKQAKIIGGVFFDISIFYLIIYFIDQLWIVTIIFLIYIIILVLLASKSINNRSISYKVELIIRNFFILSTEYGKYVYLVFVIIGIINQMYR